MKLGYPCINLSLNCKSSKSFRLKSYNKQRLISTVDSNLNCLLEILKYNKEHNIYFFRITSNLIPFASHSVMNFEWQNHFKNKFIEIGDYIKKNRMRITMHPGQYTVLNSKTKEIVQRSILELQYHMDVLDLMELDSTAKVLIHVGGVYEDKKQSIARFVKTYKDLESRFQQRLGIENDDKNYHLMDCLHIYEYTNIPIIFDVFHHECYNSGESIVEALEKVRRTWSPKDGLPIIHYSSKHPDKGRRSHADQIDLVHFKKFLATSKQFDFDIMLEIKDKEISALKALEVVSKDPRFKID